MPQSTRLFRRAFAVSAATAVVIGGGFAYAGGPHAPHFGAPTVTDLSDTGCDPIDPTACLLPFPNNWFTTKDKSTETGLRVNISPLATPQNVAGKPIDPTEWNRNDGFSPGAEILTHVPGVDLTKSDVPTVGNIGAYTDPASSVVLVDERTNQRWPVYAETDSQAPDDAHRLLLIRPAINLTEGDTYAVGLSNLRDAAGNVIPANASFASCRDGNPQPGMKKRCAQLTDAFASLNAAGVSQSSLYLAWDFTVASKDNITGRMRHMRDDAFAKLAASGRDAPQFVVTKTVDAPNARIRREVQGYFLVPSYLNLPGGPPGSNLNYVGSNDPNLPSQLPGNTQTANFDCVIPTSVDATHPGHASLYGHGLLGSAGEVTAGNVEDMAYEHQFVFCATDWLGMSEFDIPTVGAILADMSNFPKLPDRGQQGMLDFLFLARLMKQADGLDSDPAFQVDGHGVIDPGTVYYDGNSQGGIMGGAVVAISQDVRRGVLGVPGMNYSTLLDRSTDWAQYYAVFAQSYPSRVDQEIVFSLIQMLWDRAEADGYAEQMTGGLDANTPSHQVLMHVSFGDHQVTDYAALVEARTIGAQIYSPELEPSRASDWAAVGVTDPFWGLSTWTGSYTGPAAMTLWDEGPPVGAPPFGNVPDTTGPDPHGWPRAQPQARTQKALFLTTGTVYDECGGGPCYGPALGP